MWNGSSGNKGLSAGLAEITQATEMSYGNPGRKPWESRVQTTGSLLPKSIGEGGSLFG